MQMDMPSLRPRRIVEALCAASLLCGLSVVLVERPQPVAHRYSAVVPHPAVRAPGSALVVARQGIVTP